MSKKPKFYSELSDCVRSLASISSYTGPITASSWSPDGKWLVTCSADNTLALWDAQTKKRRFQTRTDTGTISDIDFSPDGEVVACSTPNGIILFEVHTLKVRLQEGIASANDRLTKLRWAPNNSRLAIGCGSGKVCLAGFSSTRTVSSKEYAVGHASSIRSLAWAPDGETLVSGTDHGIIGVWEVSEADNQLRHFLPGPSPKAHEGSVIDLAWSKTTGMLASLSEEGEIRLWNVNRRKLVRLYRCNEPAFNVRFCANGELLVVRTLDKLIFVEIRRIVEAIQNSVPDTDTSKNSEEKAQIFSMDCSTTDINLGCLSVDDASGQIAAEDQLEGLIKIWDLDFDHLVKIARTKKQCYRIAKVAVVGERGVGKTNMVSLLTGKPFVPAPSKHNLEVHRLHRSISCDDNDGISEVREVLIWDRSNGDDHDILESVDTADSSSILAVFDWQSSRSSTRDFARLRSTGQAHAAPANPGTFPNTVLIAGAKADRSRDSANFETHAMLSERWQVPRIFSTSAKEGAGIEELREAISNCIDWKQCAVFEPAEAFQDIHDFVVAQRESGKKTGVLLESMQGLSSRFAKPHQVRLTATLPEMFRTGICLLKILGEIYYFSHTDLVLLDPRYLYTYASALVRAAQRDEDRMGRLPMADISSGEGKQLKLTEIPEGERLPVSSQERLLLLAVVQELKDYRLADEVSTDGVQYLVFPSQPTRKLAHIPRTEEVAAHAKLEGNGQAAYSSLVVRLLSLKPFFNNYELYHNAGLFNPISGGECCLLFDSKQSPDASEIKIFFNDEVDEHSRNSFLGVVRSQIPTLVLVSTAQLTGGDTKVFISYEHQNRSNVLAISKELRKRNIVPWIYDLDVEAGVDEERSRNAALQEHSIAIFALADGKLDDTMSKELKAFKERQCRIIPVILPNAKGDFAMPEKLRGLAKVDFRDLASDPVERLVDGILAARTLLNNKPQSDQGRNHVFLSYYHGDEEAVGQLRDELIEENISVWWDKNILPGRDWRTQIHDAIENSYAVIACFSPKGTLRMRSGVFDELYQAGDMLQNLPSNGIHLIPVMLSTCQLPNVRLGNRFLKDIQAIDLSLGSRKEQFTRLLDALAEGRNQKAEPVL